MNIRCNWLSLVLVSTMACAQAFASGPPTYEWERSDASQPALGAQSPLDLFFASDQWRRDTDVGATTPVLRTQPQPRLFWFDLQRTRAKLLADRYARRASLARYQSALRYTPISFDFPTRTYAQLTMSRWAGQSRFSYLFEASPFLGVRVERLDEQDALDIGLHLKTPFP